MNEKEKVFAKSGGKCWYCGCDAEQIDHFVPRFLGGEDTIKNKVPVCKWCNKSKRGYDLETWRGKLKLSSGMGFSQKQVLFWKGRGEILPNAEYEFYFERMGWK